MAVFLINKYNEEQSTLPSLNLSNQSDRLGIAFKQPYIQDIPDFLKADATNAINTVTGGLVRGGVIGSTTRSIIDGLRISKFMVDPARGLPFIAKQVGLQRSNTDYIGARNNDSNNNNIIDPSAGLLANARNIVKAVVDREARNSTYGVGTPIAQAGINTLGGHLKRHGLIPRPADGVNDESGYWQSELNRISSLNSGEEFSPITNNRLTKIKYKFAQRASNSDNIVISSYKGGPGSVYGIGNTNIISVGNNIYNPQRDAFTLNKYNFSTTDLNRITLESEPPQPLDYTPTETKSYISLDKLQDFRAVKKNRLGEEIPFSKYGSGGNMESRLGIGGVDKSDSLNTLPIIRKERRVANSQSQSNDAPNGQSTRDLIRFFIEAIDTDNPAFNDYIQFRAFLESLGDSYGAKWNSFNFIGNPEQFFNYESFSRDISLSFKIAALSAKELRPMYVRLNGLISQLMPNYAEDNTRARGSYVKLTVGSYLDRVPGFITSLNVDWKKDYPWEIGIIPKTGDPVKDDNVQVLPHILDISMKFQPIHNFIPKKVTPEDPDVPFITLNSRNNNKKPSWVRKEGGSFHTIKSTKK